MAGSSEIPHATPRYGESEDGWTDTNPSPSIDVSTGNLEIKPTRQQPKP